MKYKKKALEKKKVPDYKICRAKPTPPRAELVVNSWFLIAASA